MTPRRTVFYISDRTGITAEILGKTLLTQFPDIEFSKRALPFVDTPEKARQALTEINGAAAREQQRPIVFSTLVDDDLRAIVGHAEAVCVDLFEGFLGRLEGALGVKSSHALGLTHGIGRGTAYERRMAAVNYTLVHDDGAATADYSEADVILVGVSRTGKTPVCLYLAMQYGIRAANYPLVMDDLGQMSLPKSLLPVRAKLFGCTIDPERLARIRRERRPGGRYAALETCREEVRAAEHLFQQLRLPYLDTTTMSVEEMAVTILHQTGLASRTQGDSRVG
jgi:regulator of PEP synthase PpsR (kinase-PPPase family)